MHSRPQQRRACGESFQPPAADEGPRAPGPAAGPPGAPPGFAYRRRNLSGISRSPTCGAWSVAAAWLSLVVPVVVGVFRALNDSASHDDTDYLVLFAVFIGCFAGGMVSLLGTKDGWWWSLLPPALLGMALNILLALLALLFYLVLQSLHSRT